ncbi:hypothetical protein BKA70DRAFT_1334828 [Coprinopsis sp. MPI-PUGE-AT-0042]|nr:hypothetical protein BKA70DRAFT_1334828 [Coprinopsis sp. MPI-PUGE-AT-0042]
MVSDKSITHGHSPKQLILAPQPQRDYTSNLPPEVLVHIFGLLSRGPLGKKGRLHFQAIRSVCSTWRLICFSSPFLCSSLAVNYNNNHSLSYGKVVEGWFSRAGPSMPLELLLLVTSSRGMSKEDSVALSDLLAPSSDWKNLRKLSVWTYRLYDNGRGVGIEVLRRATCIQSTPLQDLRLTIDEASTTPADDLKFIAGYTHLRKLVLRVPRSDIQADSNSPISISLPRLGFLSITGPNITILCHFDTPSLTDLEVHLRYLDQDNQEIILRHFLAQCPLVRSVILRSNNQQAEWMLSTLCAQPSITSVTIQPWPSARDGHEISHDAPWLNSWCPNLRELTVVIQSAKLISEDENEMTLLASVVSFLERRKELGQGRLDRLVFKCLECATEFPYDMFTTLGVGRVDVMGPW